MKISYRLWSYIQSKKKIKIMKLWFFSYILKESKRKFTWKKPYIPKTMFRG